MALPQSSSCRRPSECENVMKPYCSTIPTQYKPCSKLHRRSKLWSNIILNYMIGSTYIQSRCGYFSMCTYKGVQSTLHQSRCMHICSLELHHPYIGHEVSCTASQEATHVHECNTIKTRACSMQASSCQASKYYWEMSDLQIEPSTISMEDMGYGHLQQQSSNHDSVRFTCIISLQFCVPCFYVHS